MSDSASCRCAFCVAALLNACDGATVTLTPAPVSCEAQACEVIAACTPTITEGIDFTTTSSCLDAGWTCADADACLAAVEALPCLSQPPTEDELVAATLAFRAVKRDCLGLDR